MEKKQIETTVNRKHKDSVFRMIFRENVALLSLYNALFNTSYDNPDDLTVTTLENAIYMKYKNDVACIVDMRLALIEHQSTVNRNMPLRMLKYTVDLFDSITINENIYTSRLIMLPEPTYIVLYNGVESQPERRIMRLSDAYMTGTSDEPNLELVVTQLNINDAFNEELKANCPELFGYTYFISLIRSGLIKYDGNINMAVDEAIDTCIEEDILVDFFKKQRKEIADMSIYEFDEERHNRTICEEAREEGREEGREELLNQLLSDGTITAEQAKSYRKNASPVIA